MESRMEGEEISHDGCCPMAITMDVVMILMLKIITQRVHPVAGRVALRARRS